MLKTFIKSRVVTFILIFITGYLLYQNLRILYYNINYSYKIKTTNKLILSEKERNNALNKQLVEAGTMLNIEQKARTILGLIKPNEVAYKIVHKKGD